MAGGAGGAAGGGVLTPLPAPGVYAKHNAMDVPAHGHAGRPLEHSVPRVLRIRGQEADAREYAARIDRVLAGGGADRPELATEPGGEPTPPPTAHPETASHGAPLPGAAQAGAEQQEEHA